jgi:c-di-GMP-binding flagellar brake protein YcgR
MHASRLHVEETGERIEAPSEVVSNDVGPGFAPGERGMGLRFLELKPEAQRAIDELYERKLKEAAERLR